MFGAPWGPGNHGRLAFSGWREAPSRGRLPPPFRAAKVTAHTYEVCGAEALPEPADDVVVVELPEPPVPLVAGAGAATTTGFESSAGVTTSFAFTLPLMSFF